MRSALLAPCCSILLAACEPSPREVGPSPAPAAAELARQDVALDLGELVRALEDVHPEPYHSIGRDQFRRAVDELAARLPERVGLRELTVELLTLTARIDEGHTGIHIPRAIREEHLTARTAFPLTVTGFRDGGFVVEHDRGERILSVNDEPAERIRDRVRGWLGGIPSYRDARIEAELAFWLDLLGLRSPYRVELRDGAGRRRSVRLEGVDPDLLRAGSAAESDAPHYSYRVLEGDVGYLDFVAMRDLPRFRKFLEDTFRDIHGRKLRGVIVDLRRNQGGSTTLGEALLDHITARPYRFAGGAEWKVSRTYREFFRAQDPGYQALFGSEDIARYMAAEEGTRIVEPAPALTRPTANALRFEGPVAVLIGPLTFSSANMLANAIQDYDLATLFGQATGEPTNDYGEVCNVRLSRTGITFYTSSKAYIRANGDRTSREPVLPDVPIEPGEAEVAGPADPVLDAAVRWIRSHAQSGA